ncbi:MAG: hypothetical protein FJ206_05840 [Gemmatimonadetes bacterium]|nr:hypothetical protein [Gemmatimonadota bacterium]
MTPSVRRPIVPMTLAVLALGGPTDGHGQWTNRYPKVAGFTHHVYLEGYELPLVTIGPIDPAPSPDGRRIAIASRGWLWLLELESGQATRLTAGAGMDSRPAWSPDGAELAFVRDDGRETSIVVRNLARGTERVVASDPGIELDPTFAPDGRSVFYSSAAAGDLDVWRVDLNSGAKTRITEHAGLELKPQVHPDGKRLIYLGKRAAGQNEIRIRHLETGEERVLLAAPIASMARPSLSPDGRLLAVNWPAGDASGWELRLLGVEQPGPTVLLTEGARLPLTPAWSADGSSLFFAEATSRETMGLWRAPARGGPATPVAIGGWNYQAPTARVTIQTLLAGKPAAARLSVTDGNGHPLLPAEGQPRFDGQTGTVFFYSGGITELEVPAGTVSVRAVQGLATSVATAAVEARPGSPNVVTATLEPVWDARAKGWMAGEHHFHLNYGGPYRLDPDDLFPMAAGEAMDVLTPLLANLHTRFEDQPLWRWQSLAAPPFLAFGQEVRAHFFGHVAVIGSAELHWPWIWGPGYEVFGRDDRPNRDALAFGRAQGGVNMYVHPVSRANPFADGNLGTIPNGFVADAVQGLIDVIELACLWSDESGTADLWYRALNFGMPIAPSAGTDVMNNFYRTMAVGTTRVYVKSDPALGYRGYLDALKAGRSFVTTGPLLDFVVGSAGPGDVVPRSPRRVAWRLEVASANAVDRVEIVVNGAVVESRPGVAAGGRASLTGTIALPVGGWIAARAVGGATTQWPAMDSYGYGHTAPIWIGERGSTEPSARRAAATDLIRTLEFAERNVRAQYSGFPMPRIEAHYRRAREILDAALSGR